MIYTIILYKLPCMNSIYRTIQALAPQCELSARAVVFFLFADLKYNLGDGKRS